MENVAGWLLAHEKRHRIGPSALRPGVFDHHAIAAHAVEGQPAVVKPGMKGEVISLHDGFHLDVSQGESIPPKATVQFENVTLMVDERMKWERVT